MSDLRQAAQAVLDRWDSPAWTWDGPTADLMHALRAALAAEPKPVAEFEFTIDERDGDDWICVAGGVCGNREDADREAGHYASQYAQDGDVRVTVFQRVILSRTEIGGTHG